MTEPVLRARFWEKYALKELTDAEWEALCDGCGKCCLHKLVDEETEKVYETCVACRLLDLETGRCKDYAHRKELVPDCIQLTPARVDEFGWLPATCAYRLVSEGKPLPDWHYLISGSRETVHEEGHSVRGWTVSEEEVAEEDLIDYLLPLASPD